MELYLLISKDLGLFDEFHFVMKNHKRTQLQRIWKSIQKQEGKERLFQALFNRPYTSKEDYLLRNELRIFRTVARTFIANHEFAHHGEDDKAFHYLSTLLRYGYQQLFEKEYQQTVRVANAEENHRLLCKVIPLYTRYANLYLPRTPKTYRQLLEIQEQLKHSQQLHFEEQMRAIDAEKGRLDRTLQAHHPTHQIEEPLPDVALPQEGGQTKLSHYYYLKAKSYGMKGEEKISILKEALQALELVNKNRIDLKYERGLMNSNLGVEYFLNKRFAEAVPVFEVALKNTSNRLPHYPMILFNYTTSLLKENMIEVAWEVLSTNDRHWKKVPNIAFRIRCLRVATLISLDRIEQAREELPKSFVGGTKDDACYLRLCLAIIYYRKDDLDAVLVELDNLRRVANEPPVLEYVKQTVSLFRRFVQLQLSAKATNHQEKLSKLKLDFKAFLQASEQGDNSSLPILYIANHLVGVADQ